ncbi:PIN/TRAM domain-containing protein [Candidatus Hydrogenedentota bacterium]
MKSFWVWMLRVIFILFFGLVIYTYLESGPEKATPIYFVVGIFLAAIIVVVEIGVERLPIRNFTGPAVGLLLGMLLGSFLANYYLRTLVGEPAKRDYTVEGVYDQVSHEAALNDYERLEEFLPIILMVVFGYLGLVLGFSQKVASDLSYLGLGRPAFKGPAKVLDTSVIIDGRISDIVKTGIMDGVLLLPRFILAELQNIADSADSLRRARGRRGLDVLRDLQHEQKECEVIISEQDYPDIAAVDHKLVTMAKDVGGKIITNDYNLNKVAQIQGVSVININDLANALKLNVLPDEDLVVRIVKEGKEPQQGVGYLDDGTMIVVDGGRSFMGKEIKVLVTSVLQTAAGKMIFAKPGNTRQ